MVTFCTQKRLLIASDLSLRSVEKLTLIQRTIEASAPREALFRWEDPCNIRANLIFMDHVEPVMVPFIEESLGGVVEPLFPFEITIERVYAGPLRKRPRFFYAGIDAQAAEVMTLLRKMLEREFANFGLSLKKQEFRPVIFLGRGLTNFDSKRALKRVKDLKIESCFIRELSLFEAVNSTLAPRQDTYIEPTYNVLHRFTLGSS